MNTQDCSWIEDKIRTILTKNPNYSFSLIVKKLRHDKRLIAHGDCEFLGTTFRVAEELKIKNRRKKAVYALNKSDEFKSDSQRDKKDFLNSFFKSSGDTKKRRPNASRRGFGKKNDTFFFISYPENSYA